MTITLSGILIGILIVLLWYISGIFVYLYYRNKYGHRPFDSDDIDVAMLVGIAGPIVIFMGRNIYADKIKKSKEVTTKKDKFEL